MTKKTLGYISKVIGITGESSWEHIYKISFILHKYNIHFLIITQCYINVSRSLIKSMPVYHLILTHHFQLKSAPNNNYFNIFMSKAQNHICTMKIGQLFTVFLCFSRDLQNIVEYERFDLILDILQHYYCFFPPILSYYSIFLAVTQKSSL